MIKPDVFIGLGANLPSKYGEPVETLRAAKAALVKKGVEIMLSSPTYKTAPVPISDQPWYHNEVIAVQTALSPVDLLAVLQEIENDFGRVRTVRNAPRLLDLDILAFGSELIETADLIVPHPRLSERAFVLYPLRDIAPAWQHPKTKQNIADLIADLDQEQLIEKIL